MSNSNYIPQDYSAIQKQIQSEKAGSYWGGYFKQNVYGMTPTQKKSFSGRILPAFDYGLSQADADFPKSWLPYRNADNINAETGQPEFMPFFVVVSAYSWFGNKQVSFLSPTTLRYSQGIAKGPELTDPVQDIRNHAKKHDDPAIRALTEKNEQKKDAKTVIPYPQRRYMFNCFGTSGTDRVQKNYVVDVAQKAFEDLAAKLGEWRPAHEEIIDANWPHYLFGDITAPNTGLMVETAQLPSNPQPFNGFILTPNSHKSLKGTRQMPVTMEALAARYHFYGPNSVLKILSAQEIVDFLVEDGAIPYHLIQEVCDHYCNVPPPPKRNVAVSHGSGDSEEEDFAYVPPMPPMRSQMAEPARPSPAATSAPPPPPPPPPAAVAPPPPPPPVPLPTAVELNYWVAIDGANYGLLSASKVTQTLATALPGQDIMLCQEGSQTWAKPLVLGFTTPPVPAASPPPFSPPSVAPSAPPVITTGGTVEKVPDNAGLNEEEKAEMARLQLAFNNNTILPHDMGKLAALTVRVKTALK